MTASAGYSGTPLPAKLGIKPGHRVVVDGAPAAFALGGLPEGVVLHRRLGAPPYDVALLFCNDHARLSARWPVLHEAVREEGRLWVVWPKRASGVATDLDERVVREHGLSHGRVDVKVCAVDATWSGLAFVVRLADRR